VYVAPRRQNSREEISMTKMRIKSIGRQRAGTQLLALVCAENILPVP